LVQALMDRAERLLDDLNWRVRSPPYSLPNILSRPGAARQ
jgi:hypothetical protein